MRVAYGPEVTPIYKGLSSVTKGLENAELKRRGVIPCPDCDIIVAPGSAVSDKKALKEDL